jgi:hypothetical protein
VFDGAMPLPPAPREINPMFNGDLRKLLNILKLYSPSMFAVAQK